jgi:thiosulfate/3-mercaptopyruvate sulfurtransferase
MAVQADAIARSLRSRTLLDARAPARYRGEQEPIDPVAGRIPGALNRYNLDNVRGNGQFKPAEQLRKEFEQVLGARAASEVINYCGSGVAACHNLLALEIAGLPGGKLFAGSWSEWIADPARPREKG